MSSIRHKQTHSAGFTLVELLTVITIISILIGMLTLGLLEARNHAKQARAQTQLRELIKAWTQYYMIYQQLPYTGTQDMDSDHLQPLLGVNDRSISFLTVKTSDSSDSGGNFKDPWGHYYKITFATTSKITDTTAMRISVCLPNRDRYKY